MFLQSGKDATVYTCGRLGELPIDGPFFSYVGSKWMLTAARAYPAPEHNLIIEPFAGSACYASYWSTRQRHRVWLNDVDPEVIAAWRWLQAGAPALPVTLTPGTYVGPPLSIWSSTMGLGRGKVTWFSADDWARRLRRRIIASGGSVARWRITCAEYWTLPNLRATWFIDPPYFRTADNYIHHSLDYGRLARWCKGRRGQVIVCEAEGARWLPFWPLRYTNHRSSAMVRGSKQKRLEQVWISRQ
jgi:hypothetical protein